MRIAVALAAVVVCYTHAHGDIPADYLDAVKPWGKIAVYSVADAAFQAKAQTAIANKQCYCLLHGYTFVLDVYPPFHNRTVHWNRVTGVHRILPFFDWVLYLDADILITAAHIRIEHFLTRAAEEHAAMRTRWFERDGNHSEPLLIVQDSMEVNSGGFLMRGGAYANKSRLLLDRWWELGPVSNMWGAQDQGALALMMLEYATIYTGFRARHRFDPAADCLLSSAYWPFWACYWNSMARLGLPLGRRTIGSIVALVGDVQFTEQEEVARYGNRSSYGRLHTMLQESPHYSGGLQQQSRTDGFARSMAEARGFNLIAAVFFESVAWFHHPTQLWSVGAFAVHVTTSPRFDIQYWQFTDVENDFHVRTCAPGLFWSLHPLCYGRPCADDLFRTEVDDNNSKRVLYRYPSRWRGYADELPATCVPHDAFYYVPRVGYVLPRQYDERVNGVPQCRADIFLLNASNEEAGAASGRHPYNFTHFRSVTVPYLQRADSLRLQPCSPAWGPHLHGRVMFNLSSIVNFVPYGMRIDDRPAYAYVCADFYTAPWEDLYSRLLDFVARYADDEIHLGHVVEAFSLAPESLSCRAGLRETAISGPRWYMNDSDPFEMAVNRETRHGGRVLLFGGERWHVNY